MVKDKAKDVVRAALAADTLALGVHWIYDPLKVAERFEPKRLPIPPAADGYHPKAGKGGFTHYGDQCLTLLQSIAKIKSFNLTQWTNDWHSLFTSHYNGYIDHATQETLRTLDVGFKWGQAGSTSSDLAAVSRMAPIFLTYDGQDLEQLKDNARQQTGLTTRNQQILELSVFFAELIHLILNGRDINNAVGALEMRLHDNELSKLFQIALNTQNQETVPLISARFGSSCDALKMFPGVIHIITKYAHDPYEAVCQAILSAGDNAARAMLVAAVMAARHGAQFMPPAWHTAVSRKEQIEELLAVF